jgi:NitT/TauT family transport system substrate-binding protein
MKQTLRSGLNIGVNSIAPVCIFVLLFVSVLRAELSKEEGVSIPLRIGYSRLRISLPIFVAQQEGIFQKHGINAQLESYDTAQLMIEALVEGRIDVAGYTAMPISYSAMIRSGTSFLFLTTLVEDQKHRISYLLRRRPEPGQKTPIQTIADLKGKRIGVLPTLAYKKWLESLLRANGVSLDEVVIQNVDPMLEAQMLASGGVDALFTNDPAATAAIAGGAGELIGSQVEIPLLFGEPFPFASFNVSKKWADANPQLLQRLSAALNEAVLFTNAQPDRAKDDLKPYLSEAFQSQVKLYPNSSYLTTQDSSPAIYEKLAKQYQSLGIIPQVPDLTGLIYQGVTAVEGGPITGAELQ